MPILRVGHIVIKMRDLEAAKRFYGDILGMQISGEREDAVFFRFSDYHHDIAVFKAPPDSEDPKPAQVGLVHLALVTDGFETVQQIYRRLKAHDVPIVSTVHHGFTRSLYCKDPGGNEVEIYCEVPEFNWQEQGVGRTNRPMDIETGEPAPSS
jgi:catechol 2,3-dioxygenase